MSARQFANGSQFSAESRIQSGLKPPQDGPCGRAVVFKCDNTARLTARSLSNRTRLRWQRIIADSFLIHICEGRAWVKSFLRIGSECAYLAGVVSSSLVIRMYPMKRASGRMLYFVVAICAGYGLSIAPWSAFGQDEAKPNRGAAGANAESPQGEPASFWMKKKLDFSKNLLEGIALGDFDKVSQNAKTLRSLSKIESFVRRGTPGYRAQVDAFDQSLAEIIRQAEKENLEGTTLAFHQLTGSCVKCHRELRETK